MLRANAPICVIDCDNTTVCRAGNAETVFDATHYRHSRMQDAVPAKVPCRNGQDLHSIAAVILQPFRKIHVLANRHSPLEHRRRKEPWNLAYLRIRFNAGHEVPLFILRRDFPIWTDNGSDIATQPAKPTHTNNQGDMRRPRDISHDLKDVS